MQMLVRSYLILFLFLVSCGKGYHDLSPDRIVQKPKVVTYSWLEQNVFLPNCISCHGEFEYNSKGGGIPLYAYDHFLMESEGVWKEISRDRMPKEGRKLTAVEKSWIREWLDAEMPE